MGEKGRQGHTKSPTDTLYERIRATSIEKPEDVPVVRAAAGILWRPAPDGIEIYLAQRSEPLPFLGGFWTCPGGKLEGAEMPEQALVRELHEELGLTLEVDGDWREAGRWLTPSFSKIRIDARYFLIRSDADPDWRCSQGELSAGEWMKPRSALRRWRSGQLMIPAPALRVLEALVHGLGGAELRIAEQAEIEARQEHWILVPGIRLCPVRTPTLPPATHTNCYVLGDRELLVVDPASPYPDEQERLARLIAELESEGRRVVGIWLTHHHGDHVGGAVDLARRTGAPIACHALTRSLLGDIEVDRVLEDGDTWELAGEPAMRVVAVFTPGHAPGHLCARVEPSGALVAGDMVAGIGTILIEPTEGDMAAYIASLQRMKELAPSVLLPAHGPPIGAAGALVDRYIQHRLWREERVLQALGGDFEASSALVARAYSDVPAAIHPIAERSLIAHLVKLVAEGRARARGELYAATEIPGAL